MAQARAPKERPDALSKPEMAIEEVDRVIASGGRFGCVLADSGYGPSRCVAATTLAPSLRAGNPLGGQSQRRILDQALGTPANGSERVAPRRAAV